MKIINLETFLAMPAGTVFCKYSEVGNFGDICIKESNVGINDFCYTSISDALEASGTTELFDILLKQPNGEEIEMDFSCSSRDGLFDKDQLFSVWSLNDMFQFQAKLALSCDKVWVKTA